MYWLFLNKLINKDKSVNNLSKTLSFVVLIFMAACSTTPELNDLPLSSDKLHIEKFFAGKTTGYGQFQDRFGKVRRRFVVEIQGKWDGDNLTLVEDFVYEDKSTEQRIWTLQKTNGNSWVGTAKGVEGVANGVEVNDTFNWKYSFNLQGKSGTTRVDFDDWMWLLTDKRLLNRAYVSKYGINIGEVILYFEKKY